MNSKTLQTFAQSFVNKADFANSLKYLQLTELFDIFLTAEDEETVKLADDTAKALAGPEWLTEVWNELGA